ncbi:MAG TPA: SpoIID/LytB domain-containing protein [Exilispira sp.]|nr:SpoIID/LytB domain-containing protein [Exilispira sp.]
MSIKKTIQIIYNKKSTRILNITLICIFIFFLLILSSCTETYQYIRETTGPGGEGFVQSFPEKKDLGIYSSCIDANIRVRMLITEDSSFEVFSDSPIYKDGDLLDTSVDGSYIIKEVEQVSTFVSETGFTFKEKNYGKQLIVQRKDSNTLYLISSMPLIYYLAGVARAEMGMKFPEEAIKAQIIAARTYFWATKLEDKPYDITNSINSQVFLYDNISFFIPLVAQTDNLVLLYDYKIFPAYFHSNSGGILTTPDRVWGKTSSPVFQVKPDPYSDDYTIWKADIGRYFIKTLFERAGYAVDGYATSIKVDSVGIDKRATTVTVSFSNNKTYTTSSDAFRKIVGTTVIKSTIFSVCYNENSQNFTFSGYGYGHGVGLSQIGAKNMAEKGFNYLQILAFYYNSSTISYKIKP